MKKLVNEISKIRKSPVESIVKNRIAEFQSFNSKDSLHWFSELCFCILTANSKARTALGIQGELGGKGFLEKSFEDVRDTIIRNKHRFHNNKAKYIVEARKLGDVKALVQELAGKEGQIGARNWLAKNVIGIGYKEASHFMRNVGYFDVAILDRHILRLMKEHSLIEDIPKSLTSKVYLDFEAKFLELGRRAGMSAGELDLYMWYMKVGEVLK